MQTNYLSRDKISDCDEMTKTFEICKDSIVGNLPRYCLQHQYQLF